MKVFLVFLALLFINLSFFIYGDDLQHYEKLQNSMKAIAEDCAAGAALYYEKEAYGRGEFQIEQRAATDYMEMQLQEATSGWRLGNQGKFSGQIRFGERETIVTVTYQGKDLFRLPFLEKTQLSRTAKYKWEE